jgi:hypothetical protein
VNFFGGGFCHFVKKYFDKEIFYHKFPLKIMTQNEGFILKIASTAYNMKKCSRFSTVIFAISPNLAKHTYG